MVSVEILQGFGLFKGLDDSELAKIAELCRERMFKEGAVCFTQGKTATDLHLCRSGKVEIVVQLFEPWPMDVNVHTARAGEVMGWSALVPPHTYTASAKCSERTQDICIKGSELMELMEGNPHMGHVVMRNLSAAISSRLTESRYKLSVEIAAEAHKEW